MLCNVFTDARMHEHKHKCMHNSLTELLFHHEKCVWFSTINMHFICSIQAHAVYS